MRPPLPIALAAVLALAAACARAAQPGAAPTVVLLSFDGTRPDQVRELPAFRRIAERGAFGAGLEPAFPSNTFPNHVTFVTGVAPDRHGIVSNVFEDPERGLYRYEADPTWIEVEPLWSLLARAGIASASFHWVGSEGAWRSGLGPRAWHRFDGSVPESEKVDQILVWLGASEPPRFVTAWFHGADGAGHRHGPDSRQAAASLRVQDAELGRLLDALEARGLMASTTLVLVSDHGMARVERSVDLERTLRRAGLHADAIGGGGFATVQIEAARGEDAKVLADRAVSLARGLRGAHGHRPEEPAMTGLFAAVGRGVDPGLRPDRVRAVDVAPTVLSLLGQPVPTWMEGRPVSLHAEPIR